MTGPGGVTISDPAHSISTAPTVTCVGSCTAMPTNSVVYPVAIPQTGVAVKWFNAAVGSGGGTFHVVPTVTLSIAARTRVGTYTATETYSINQGP
jgi:hypothetical protein